MASNYKKSRGANCHWEVYYSGWDSHVKNGEDYENIKALENKEGSFVRGVAI